VAKLVTLLLAVIDGLTLAGCFLESSLACKRPAGGRAKAYDGISWFLAIERRRLRFFTDILKVSLQLDEGRVYTV